MCGLDGMRDENTIVVRDERLRQGRVEEEVVRRGNGDRVLAWVPAGVELLVSALSR